MVQFSRNYVEKYVGKIVHLNKEIFEELKTRAIHQGQLLENYFVVSAVSQNFKKLICYGANFRVVVDVSEVVLV